MPDRNTGPRVDVSVVIPAFNPGPYLRQTIDSVLSQQGVVVEVIVVDDGSTDETPTVLENYGFEIKSIQIPNSGGPSTPRNVGFRTASAEFISFFDADDVMLPGKLETAVSLLKANPTAGMVCTDFQGIDAGGQITRDNWLEEYRNFRSYLKPINSNRGYILPAEDSFRQLLRANFVGTSSVVCRRQALVEAGPFCEEMKNSDDRDMWFRIARAGWDFLFIDKVYHSYRKSGGGVTARGGLRNIAIIKGFLRQLPYITEAEDRQFVLRRIQSLWAGYGYWLRKSGDHGAARKAYCEALGYGIRPKIILGWLKARFGV